MPQPKVLHLLAHLSRRDQSSFSRYLACVFFKVSPQVAQLYQWLQRENCLSSGSADKRKIYQELWGVEDTAGLTTRAIGKKIDPLFYQLKTHLEDFLVWKQGQKPGFRRDQALIQAYYDLDAEKPFQEQCDKVLRNLDAGKAVHSDVHLHKFLVLRMRYYQFSRVNLDLAAVEKQRAAHHLDAFFVVQKLVQSYASLTRNIIHNKQEPLPFMEAVLEQAALPHFSGDFHVQVFLPLLKGMLRGEFDQDYFHQICALIPQNLPKIPKEEQFGVMKVLLDYYLFLEQFTRQPLPDHFFMILDNAFEKGILSPNGKMSYIALMLYVRTACGAKEFAKAAQVVTQMEHHVTYQGQPCLLTVPRAYISYAQKDFSGALRILNQNEKAKFVFDKLLERILLVQCYFEAGEDDLLAFTLEGSRKFISRLDAVGELVKFHFRNFLQCTRELALARQRSEALPNWEAKLEAGSIAFEQSWLLEKIRLLAPALTS